MKKKGIKMMIKDVEDGYNPVILTRALVNILTYFLMVLMGIPLETITITIYNYNLYNSL